MNPLFDDTSLLENLPLSARLALQQLWHQCDQAQIQRNIPLDLIHHARFNLIKWALLRSFSSLYYRASITDIPRKEIFVVSSIWSDGLGDFFALLYTAAVLQKHLPGLPVHLIFHHKQKLPVIQLSDFGLSLEQLHVFKESDNPLTHILEPILTGETRLDFEEEYEKICHEQALDITSQEEKERQGIKRNSVIDECIDEETKALEKLQPYFALKEKAMQLRLAMIHHAQAIIHVSVAIDTFSEPLLRPKSLYFAESGNFQGIENSFKLNWYSLGLSPFGEGFFLHSPLQKNHSHWDSSYIAQLLETSPPYYFGYFNHIEEIPAALFLHLVVALQRHRKEDLYLFMLSVKQMTQLAKIETKWLIEQGIGAIVHHGASHVLQEYSLSSKGKTLHVVDCFPLSSLDFTKMVRESGFVVGCTGDSSFGSCLGAKKLPFYEVRRHKTKSYQELVELAALCSGGLDDLMNYLENVGKAIKTADPQMGEIATKWAMAIENKGLQQAWHGVTDEIQKNFDLEKSLIAKVKRHLLYASFPELQAKEESFINSYLQGELSYEETRELTSTLLHN